VAEQECLDPVGVLQEDRGNDLGSFEEVVASFEVGLVAVGGQDLGVTRR
jgi:hypothetical protein